MRIAVLGLLAACGSVSGKTPDAAVTRDSAADAHGDAGPDAPTCAAKPASLAARWRGEMDASDSLNNYNGTTVGNITFTPGKHGSAFLLDGASYVTIDDSDALWPAASFSLEAWVNTTRNGNLLEKYACWNFCPSNRANALWALSVSNGVADFQERPDAGTTISEVTDSLHMINDGQWHHLVGVRDSQAAKLLLYVDGALAVSANLTQAQNGAMTNSDGETDLIAIGASPSAGTTGFTPTFTGAVDEVAYYSDALTAQQIGAIYAAPQGECP